VGSAFYDWGKKSCRAKTGGDASSPDLRARAHGHALAAGLAPEVGQWVLVEAYGDEVGELLQPKTFAFGALRITRGSRLASTRRDSTVGAT
jgi:hypothetical protein